MNQKVFIRQDGSIPGHRIIKELESRGGKNNYLPDGFSGESQYLYYYIKDNQIRVFMDGDTLPFQEGYIELLYNKGTDTFYEKTDCFDCLNDKGCINCQDGDMKETKSERMVSADAKEALLPNESTLSEKEKETIREKITYVLPEIESFAIPEGYETIVENGKVIVRKKKWQLKEGDIVWFVKVSCTSDFIFTISYFCYTEGNVGLNAFPSREEAQAFCDKLYEAISPLLEERRKEVGG